MKIFLLIATLLSLSLILISCKKDNPVPPEQQPQVNLTLEDVSCTEAWIKLSTINVSLPVDVELQKDGSFYRTINLILPDTILYIDSLLPNRTYSFISILQSVNQSIRDSVSAATWDTTSHNFTWQTWTFGGQAGSCTLNDVAIIDENNIWAVGEIYLLDSLGQSDPYPYNLAKWNGISWNLKKINYQGFPPAIHSILVINKNDIWLDPWFHWDGQDFQELPIAYIFMGVNVTKMWGNSNEIYVVGNNGFMAHYQNEQWSKIESSTDLNINDLWGYTDNAGEELILCAASNFGTNDHNKLLKIRNNKVDTLNWTPQRTLYTVWFNSFFKTYAGGSGVFTNSGSGWIEENSLPHNFTFRIRGNNNNDVYATGGLGYFAHFNGYSWQELSSIALSGGDYKSISTKSNTICVVGYEGAKAVVTIISK